MTDVPARPASGVRIAGDDYQHLVTWNELLHALLPTSTATHITVEAPDAGNLDDIVVEHHIDETVYTQVKHAVDATTPVGHAYLLRSGTGTNERSRRSLLARFRDSWVDLRERGPLKMQLVTDREVDPTDPLLRLLDRRTELLVPSILLDGLPQAAVAARAEWADHLGVDQEELIDMLSRLRFRTGRPYNAEDERAQTLMWGHGLRIGPQGLANGLALVRGWVQERWRRRSVEQLREIIADSCDVANDAGALLVVEAIDDDPHPEDGTEHIRFVEHYDGDDPNSRRQLRDPDDWQGVVRPAIVAAAERLRASGHRRVVVRGAMRLPVWFAVGAGLRHVRGFSVAGLQHGGLWSSDDATAPFPEMEVTHTEIGRGTELAVAVGVATDPTTAVAGFVRAAGLPVARLITLTPPGGTGPEAVPDSTSAARLAVAAKAAVVQELDERGADMIHLFLATPGGFGLLLGHRWNALRPTTVYEHLGAGRGYAPTITVAA